VTVSPTGDRDRGAGAKSAPQQQSQAQSSWAEEWDRRATTLAVLLMALATLGSSWSAYQSSLWNGIQIFHLNDAATMSRQAGQKMTIAGQQRNLDIALFMQYAQDFYEGKQKQVEFVMKRMRPDFRQVVEAWMATEPRKNVNAPSTPFVMPQYRQPLAEEANELEKKSGEIYSQARSANRTSDTYTLLGVLYTSALFLSGLISGFDQRPVRRILLALSLAILILAIVVMAGQPIAHVG
jgi:hypothetical protein